MMNSYSDEQLIDDHLGGDEKSLEVLIGRYLKPVYGFVFRYVRNQKDAEDITQEVFVKVWRNLKKFDRKKNFKAWVFVIAKNRCIDFSRKKKEIIFSEFEDRAGRNMLIETLTDSSLLPDEFSELGARADALNAVVRRLPAKYRKILDLYYGNDLNFREIARSLGEPLNTVKSRHRRSLILLRKLVTGSS